ncbi:hypothetical protein GCM10025780_30800 [Frondihabitans cladoniiphilus]|uniref:Uncharacterized protein n=1 Tax=Frondihabitans cladoniiphilus TaxID=715785 RepID=A0ABP8W6T9_9MICO
MVREGDGAGSGSGTKVDDLAWFTAQGGRRGQEGFAEERGRMDSVQIEKLGELAVALGRWSVPWAGVMVVVSGRCR